MRAPAGGDGMTSDLALSGTNLERAADYNQRVTLHAIRIGGALTRVELAEITGLTPPAVANITKRLLDDGLIEQAGQLRGGRGQPPTTYRVNRTACYSLGVNIDRDHVTIVLVDFVGETVARRSRETAFALPDEVAAMYREAVPAMTAEAGVDPARIVGIGVAIPDDLGAVDLPGRPDAYAQWSDVDLQRLLAGPLDLPLFVENDAAAAAMGEMQLGHGQSDSSFFYILITSGLGGGVVADGKYVRGASGRSGEIGFLPTRNEAGAPEQVQAFVSLSGLGRFLERKGLALSDLLGEAEPGAEVERATRQWVGLAAERLAAPLVAVNCLLNPGCVLIGGRLPARHVEELAALLDNHVRQVGAQAPVIAPVRRAALSEDAPAVGGAILPFSHYLLPRTASLWKTAAGDAPLRLSA